MGNETLNRSSATDRHLTTKIVRSRACSGVRGEAVDHPLPQFAPQAQAATFPSKANRLGGYVEPIRGPSGRQVAS